MRRVLLMLTASLVLAVSAFAQERTVSGKVTSTEDGSSLPGVNVQIKGTTSGTVTDANGAYSVTVSSGSDILVFSFIGFTTSESVVGERSIIDITLGTDVTQLSEVVVTAQGIEKDERSLGYALQSVKGTELAQRSETNLLNTLQGKLSGVNITGASGAAGASTNINIRGISSFSGSNQPLIVVDGILFDNSVNNTTNNLFGTQPSNRLNDISPENIESVNVLKGPAAAALYGSRAANGVILITTKRGGGTTSGKTEVTVTSSVNFQNVAGLAKFQNQYGQGANNDFNNASSNSWGPAFGGDLTEVVTLQGETVPYKAFPNNVSGFYDQGRVIQNGVNIASGDKDNNLSLSISSTYQNGIIPESKFSRNSVQLAGNSKLTNGLKVGSSLTYVQSKQAGVTQGNGSTALGQMTRIPRSYDLLGRPFEDVAGKSIYYSTSATHPLWSTKYERVDGTVDRLFGFVKLGYDIKPWLNVSYRVTADTYTDRRQLSMAIGSGRAPTGQVQENMIYNAELNGDLMISASKENLFLDGLSGSILLGQNINQRRNQNTAADATTLTIPGFENLSNGSVFTGTGDSKTLRRLVGFYTDVNLNYKEFLYLEFQGRLDKSSTLPEGSNAFFYPSLSASFVPTQAFDIESEILSYAKVRASVAKVGNDASPYVTGTFFVPSSFGNNVASVTFPLAIGAGVPGFQPSSRLGNRALTPEFTTAWDAGINVGLFNNKLSVDVGYFSSSSTDQILNVALSNASGYDTQTSNVGEMTNKGWEFELSATPYKQGDFSWEISANLTRIRNKVVSIIEGVESSTIPGNTFTGISPSFKVGSPYGVIIGTGFAKNANGDRLVNPATGLYAPGIPNTVIADPNRSWIAGLTNTFRYKGITLSALFDIKYGGDLYSFGWVDLKSNGSLELTAADRDQPRILPGVIDNGDKTFTDNYIQIPAQSYWSGLGGLASEAAVFDATTYRLRELSLSYELPKSLLTNTPFGSISVGVSGRNLWFYAPHAPGDPELNGQGAGNIQGMDLNGAPNTKNFGFNVRLTL